MLSSPFTPKFGTNHCADEEEIPKIASILAETSLRLNILDDEIAILQQALIKLTQERDALQEYADEHRAFLAPIRRMPLDVLQEIFIACLPSHRNSAMSASEAPVSLGRICSSWRSISLLTPILWSRVHIVEPGPMSDALAAIFHQKIAQRLEATETWLRRSGQCPLFISVQCGGRSRASNPFSASSPIIQALLPHASRWQNISFSAPPILPKLSEADVPLLKSLTLHYASFGVGTQGFLRAPQLSSVKFVGGDFAPLELPLPWDRLSELTLEHPARNGNPPMTYSQVALRVLALCSVLQSFRLCVRDQHGEGPFGVDVPILRHMYLQSLDLSAFTLAQLRGHLVLPNLRTLLISGYLFRDDNISDISLPSFLAGSPQLERVQINVGIFTQTSLRTFIRSLPQSTRQLEILPSALISCKTSIDRHTLLLLAPSPLSGASSISCPILEELVIHQCSSFSDEDLGDFIKSRMADGGSTLRRVMVGFKRAKQVDILPGLQQFIESGLKVGLRYEEVREPQLPRSSPRDGLGDTSSEYL